MVLAVETLASQLVKPAAPPPFPLSTIPSCDLDLIIANIYVKTVYFFHPNCTAEGSLDFFNRHVFLQSLSQALSLFYPFAGTLASASDFAIDCNGRGALFVDALADCSIDDLGELTPDPELLKLVPTLEDSQDVTSRPLLLLQVTEFKCGGVALGMALEHHAGDGVSALNFMKTWCSLARGDDFTTSPSFDKAWLTARDPPTPTFSHFEYVNLPQPNLKEHKSLYITAEQKPIVRMFDLPQVFLHKLKRDGGGMLSTYEMLAAHVWRCCCQARMLASKEESMLVMAVDGRGRLKGMKNPENFVGNVIFNCCVSLSAGEIVSSSVVTLAKKIQSAIRRMDEEYCKSALDFLETKTEEELASYVKGPHTFANPNLGFISWTKLPFYEIDFGWGNAAHVGPAHIPWEGHAYLLASPPSLPSCQVDTLRLAITLQRVHMHKFSHLLLNY